MLRQTHFTFTLAKLRLLQVGLRDLPYRLLTQAASVEPRSSKSAGRTRANRTGSTSSRASPAVPAARLPVSARAVRRDAVRPPAPRVGKARPSGAGGQRATYQICRVRRLGNAKSGYLPRSRKCPRWRGRSGACLKTVTAVPPSNGQLLQPARPPPSMRLRAYPRHRSSIRGQRRCRVPRAPKKRKALRLTATRR